MSVDGEAFVPIAQRILAAENSEIGWRVATSRAYYGAFHCCRDLVDLQPSIPVNAQLPTHERIYRAIGQLSFSFPGAKDLKKLTYLAQNLRDRRVEADYEVTAQFHKDIADQTIAGALDVLQRYKQYRTAHNI